jgi:CheY-like chemotaxis protein
MLTATAPARHIVLAEDNDADIFLVREILKEQGIDCELKVISDGEDVLKYIDQLDADSNARCPELLLLDMHLPKRDGEEILARLRTSQRCRQTPVVIMTSADSPYVRKSAEKHSALHYFEKPSNLDHFMRLGIVLKDVIDRGA